MTLELPKSTAKPCSDCPWRRNALPGWLGPHDAQQWTNAAYGEGAIACHQTIVADENGDGDWSHPAIRQCRGAAIFRANICKLPRDPSIATGPRDTEAVFASAAEFHAYHEGL